MLKLSPYEFPEQVSSSHLTNDLNEAFRNADIMIENHVPSPSRGISKETRKKYKKVNYEVWNNGQMVIHRFPMFAEGKNPIQRAFRYMFVNLAQYIYGVKADDIDIIYSGSTPPTQGLLCGIVKTKLTKKYGHKVPYLYVLQDVFPDSLVNAGMTKKGSALWKIGRIIEDYTYRVADKIIVISNDIKENIIKKGVPEDKITVIPNWVNTERVRPILRIDNSLYEELGISREGFYVVYAGNLGKAQSIDTILSAAALLRTQEDIQFIIFGSGTEKEEIEKKAKNLHNVRLYPLLPSERISEVYSLGNVSIVACKKDFGKGSIPSKTYSIMSTGTPVMLSFDKESELWNLIKSNDCGYLSEAENALDLSDQIMQAYRNPEDVIKRGNNARKLVCEKYSAKVATQKYIQIIRNLVINE